MPAYVALLRGVNVGGKTKLSMADLRLAADDCGFEDVRTYIQSGNMVLRASGRADAVTKRLRTAVRELTGLDTEIAVRSRDQLAKVIENNPFASKAKDAGHLHVLFLVGTGKPSLAGLDLAAFAPEEIAVGGREVYFHLPGGLGRSKLAAAVGRRRDATGTMRNWRTVNKLMEMVDSRG